MRRCVRCGEAPGDGDFCVACGSPVTDRVGPPTPTELPDDTSERLRLLRSDTAERPAVAVPPPPPPPFEPASNARFPLYADDPGHGAGAGGSPVLPPMPGGPDAPSRGTAPGAWLWWVLIAVALVAAGGFGAWLALRDDGTRTDAGSAEPTASATASPSASAQPDPQADRPSRTLTARATARVPAVAAPNQDLRGRVTTYGPDNLFDGRRSTAWRMPGNGRGELITIRLPRRVVVTEVGMINGYAKVVAAGGVRWYPRNRRVLEVRWSFDDGSVVRQQLRERSRMQTTPVDRERTRTIRLRLLRVSAPGGRDFTAISEIGLWGR